MTLYKNRYRIGSVRLKGWDYSLNGYYFVTICTRKREHYFGEIENGKMKFSKIGEIVQKYWLEIPEHFDHVKPDSFVVMPNHIHGIVVIEKPINIKKTKSMVETPMVETPNLGVSTIGISPLGVSTVNRVRMKKPEWKSGNLGVIINQFKRICTIKSGKNDYPFHWQSRFYDHIVRNKKELLNIRNYIKNNPINWNEDKLNNKNYFLNRTEEKYNKENWMI